MTAQSATALVTYLDDSTITISAGTDQEIADLRRLYWTARQPGVTRLINANIDGKRQSLVIDHADLAGVRLVTT